MPLKLDKKCKVCKIINMGDASLLKRLYHCSKFRIDGEALTDIHRDYADSFSYNSLGNHMKKHQYVRASELKKSVERRMAQQGVNTIAEAVVTTVDVRKKIMARGLAGIEAGNIKIRTTDVLRAAKDQDDIEARKGDQALMAAELMMRIASGELAPLGEDDGTIPGGNLTRSVATAIDITPTDTTRSS